MYLLTLLLAAGLTAPPPAARPAVPRWDTLPAAQPLPPLKDQGYVDHEGARIWYGRVGSGQPVILLHGGMASSLSWGNQVPPLVTTHHAVILIDSRGHGRSSLGPDPLSYALMERDVIAVMDALHLQRASFVGWSDGAIISLVAAMKNPERVDRVYAFGANMDTSAVLPNADRSPILPQLAARLAREYAALSPTPEGFAALHQAVEAMQKKEPDYTAAQLAAIHVAHIAIVDGEHDEFIRPAHTAYLARTIPGARLIILPGVSHFAPWQDPSAFNQSVVRFLDR